MVDLVIAARPAQLAWKQFVSEGLHCEFRSDVGLAVLRAYQSHEWVYDALRSRALTEVFRGRRPVVAGRLGEVQVVVKRMYHGGLFGRITGDAFLTARRVRAHVDLAEYLAGHGIDTAPVVFTAWRRRRGLVRSEIGFEWIEGAVDADRYFFGNGERAGGWEEKARELGAIVARLHRIGFAHGDLNLMNFLFGRDGKIYVLDLDKSVCTGVPLAALRSRRNMDRLERSIRKQGRNQRPGYVGAIVEKVRHSWISALALLETVYLSWSTVLQDAILLA